MQQSDHQPLGPLAPLSGVWEGDDGVDISWIDGQQRETPFRERAVFEPLGPVRNGPQELYGLRYNTTAWRLGEAEPFHEELGYWLWDAGNGEVMRCFMVPRGVLINAGGTAQAGSRQLDLAAELGSPTYGILSNKFLDASHKTVKYTLHLQVEGDDVFSYSEDTALLVCDGASTFHHTDRNRLQRIA